MGIKGDKVRVLKSGFHHSFGELEAHEGLNGRGLKIDRESGVIIIGYWRFGG